MSDFFGEDKSNMFRESKELLVNINLDDFALDSFDLNKLLNSEEKSFVIQKSGCNDISIETIHACVTNCLETD